MEHTAKDEKHQLHACLRVAALSGLNATSKIRLLEHFSDVSAIFSAPAKQLQSILSVSSGLLRKSFNAVDEARIDQQLALLAHHDIKIILHTDPSFPTMLKHIDDAPAMLFTRGDATLLSAPQLAMVGSRNASPGGLKTAQAFASDFARSGLTITSGLAAGIDTAAHTGALEQLGRTVAVVATGPDEVYPRSNLRLAQAIVKHGCMVSEFPPQTPALRAHFPRRNRLISGLSLGVLVVEADTRSGSLITARLAGEQGREIFAIPGSIHSPTSRGCHQLIRQGAKLVETTADVLQEIKTGLKIELINHQDKANILHPAQNNLDSAAGNVLKCIDFAPTRLEDIATDSNLSIELVLSILLQLELAGKISPLPGGQYQRIPE